MNLNVKEYLKVHLDVGLGSKFWIIEWGFESYFIKC